MSTLEKAKRFWQRFKKEQRGTTAIIFGIMIIPLIAVAGGVIDYGRAVKTKSQLITTLDAAVLAAMRQYALDDSTDYKSVIKDFVAKNLDDEAKSYYGNNLAVTVPDISDEGELTATISADVHTNFLRLVGFDEFNVHVNAAAIVGGSDLEIALVLDNTGSMAGYKIETLKSAAQDLVDTIIPDEDDNDDHVKIALVPFSDYVNIGKANRDESGLDIPKNYKKNGQKYKWHGCMASRAHDLNVSDEDYGTGVPGIMMTSNNCKPSYAPIKRLSTNKKAIKKSIKKMKSTGWTYIPGGLMWGWRLLSDQTPFADGVSYDDKDVKKAIVLMTDGANTVAPEKWTDNSTIKNAGEVWHHTRALGDASNVPANALTSELCTNIKEKGILIFTIAFQVPEGSEVESLMKACSGNGGKYFDADDSEELGAAFKEIALSLLNLRLSR